ncbi:MAG: heavy metal translocating P-type ATPase [Bacillota bacterium]
MKAISSIPGRVRFKNEILIRDKKRSEIIEFYLKDAIGIRNCKINPAIGTVVILYDTSKIDLHEIQEKLQKLMHSETPYLDYLHQHFAEYLEEEKKLKRSIKKMAFFGGIYLLFKIKQFFFGKFFLNRSLPVLKMAAAITIIKGYPQLNKTYKKVGKYFPTDADKLILLLGTSFTFMREGNKGTMLLFLKSVTDVIQSYTELQNKKLLLQSSPNPTRLMWYCYEGEELLMPLKAMEAGDVVAFYNNETITIEGNVIDGEGLVNQIFYTGQPELRHLKKGDRVSRGMVVTSGKLKVRINNIPQERPKPDLKLKDLALKKRVSAYQERSIYFASVMAAASYFITGTTLSAWSVFLMMTPSAAKVTITSGLTNYMKLLRKHEIVLRNINTVEKLIHVNSLIFDKTGTLTKGRLRISHIELYNKKYTEEEILEICAACEGDIHHPVAHALRDESGVQKTAAENILYIPSRGVISDYKGVRIVIGNEKLMEEEKIKGLPKKSKTTDSYDLPIYVAVGQKLAAKIALTEEVEEDALALIRYLQRKGVTDISIISGDLQRNVNHIGSQLNIQQCHGEFSMGDKERYIQEKKKHGTVIMIGDGVNDTHAMKAADISISYNIHAAEQAVVQSDSILANKHMMRIADLLELSEKSYKGIENNVRFSQYYNMIFGILAMMGYIDPFEAKTLNTMNSIIAVLNSSRIQRIRPTRA